MNFELTDAQKAYQKQIRDFCQVEITPKTAIIDQSSFEQAKELIRDNMKKIATLGYLGMRHDAVYGGTDGDSITQILTGEELARLCPATYMAAEVSARLVGMALAQFGTAEQKECYLPGIICGDIIGGGVVVPDASKVSVTAEKKGSTWVLNGLAQMMGNAPVADVMLVIAAIDGEDGIDRRTTAFIIDKDTAGIAISPPLDKLGIRGLLIANVDFDACEVSENAVLGTIGSGGEIADQIQRSQCVGIAIAALGISVASMEEGREYFKRGNSLHLTQMKSFKFADMMVMTDLSRLLLYQAAWAEENKDPEAPVLASCANVFARDAVRQISDWVLELEGTDGYVKGSVAERLCRDARFCETYGSISESLKNGIAANILKKYK